MPTMEIKFEPYNKITIRNCMYHNKVDDFAGAMTLALSREGGGRLGHLLWGSGILFRHSPFAPSDAMTKEYLQGHLPIDNIEFTEMASFKDEIYYKQYTITVLDISNNVILGNIAKWISENKETMKSTGKTKVTKKVRTK